MTAMITLKEKIGYGLGDMASSMFWKLFGSAHWGCVECAFFEWLDSRR